MGLSVYAEKLAGLTRESVSRLLLFWNTDVQVDINKVKRSGIVQHLLWDAERDFPNHVLSLSLGFVVAWLSI